MGLVDDQLLEVPGIEVAGLEPAVEIGTLEQTVAPAQAVELDAPCACPDRLPPARRLTPRQRAQQGAIAHHRVGRWIEA